MGRYQRRPPTSKTGEGAVSGDGREGIRQLRIIGYAAVSVEAGRRREKKGGEGEILRLREGRA